MTVETQDDPSMISQGLNSKRPLYQPITFPHLAQLSSMASLPEASLACSVSTNFLLCTYSSRLFYKCFPQTNEMCKCNKTSYSSLLDLCYIRRQHRLTLLRVSILLAFPPSKTFILIHLRVQKAMPEHLQGALAKPPSHTRLLDRSFLSSSNDQYLNESFYSSLEWLRLV